MAARSLFDLTGNHVRSRGFVRVLALLGRGWTAALLAASLITASLVVATIDASPARAFPASLIPGTGTYFGSWVAARGGESPDDAVRRIESMVGRRLDIDHQYYKWNMPIPTQHERWDVQGGRIPFVSWFPGRTDGRVQSWTSIADGSQDAWIQARAQAFEAFGAPCYLTFNHEPEDDSFGQPSDFVAAFRHIVDVFRSQGVTNVAFVWTMMSWSFDPGSGRNPDAFYPGDDYVDVIGLDGYNWFPSRSGAKWITFGDVFASGYQFAVSHGKPAFAAEYGVQEDPSVPGRKAAWFADELATIKAWPDMKALIYFDENKDGAEWVTDSSTSSAAGYAAMAQDPYMNQLQAAPPVPPATLGPTLQNGLNKGPDAAPIVAGRPRRARSAFDAVTVTAGASLTYDDKHALGRFSAKHVLVPGSDAFYEWDGERSTWYGRIYVWLGRLPSNDLRLIRAASNGTLRCSIDLLTTGALRFNDNQNRGIISTSIPVRTHRWVRIEWRVNHVRGRIQIRLFNHASTRRATQVVTSGSGLAIGSSANQFQFGRSGQQQFAVRLWTDGPALSSSGYIGPAGRSPRRPA